MKKLIAILILLVYFVFSAGVVVNLHYCGGKLGGVNFFKQSKSCCDDANMEGSCCKNSSSYYKIHDSSYKDDVTVIEISVNELIGYNHVNSYHSYLSALKERSKLALASHGISLSGKQPKYLSHRVLII